jgi:hypothetical protein
LRWRAEPERLERAAEQAAALPRLFLLEDEYKRAVLSSELNWVRTVITDVDTGALHWDQAWIDRQIEKAGHPLVP